MSETQPGKLKAMDTASNRLIGRSGKVYFIEEDLSGIRYMEFEAAQKELAVGLSVGDLFKELISIYELTNTTKTVRKKNGDVETQHHTGEIAYRIYNIAAGVQKIDQRKSTILKICSLFINEEKEDRGTYIQSVMDAKMEDLATEYSYKTFFKLASGCLAELIENYESLARLGLQIPVVE